MFNVDDFFTLMKFYDENKNVIGTDNAPTSNEIVYSEETKFLDPVIIQTAIESKQKTLQYFQNVLDLIPFNTADYNRLRRFFIDWNSSNRTLIKLNRSSTNPFSMDFNILNEAIKSFGFDYSYLIKDKSTRALFLLSLVDLYKIKGSPLGLSDALKFFGFSNTALYEWWLIRQGDELIFEGRLVNTEDEYLKEFPTRRYITWDTFEEIKDSHWFYTKDQILTLDQSSERYIGLPSLTPYFTISNSQEVDSINSISSVLARLFSDQWNNFKTTAGQPPHDMLIDSGQFYLSVLEIYLGILYAYWKYNDWIKYSALYSFISSQFFITPETDYLPFVYTEPYAYEKLLYWCSIRADEFGDRQPLDITNSNLYNTSMLHPVSGVGFALYPSQMEFWTADNQPDLASGYDDSSLNYDISVIGFDDDVFFPLLNNLPQFPSNTRYLHANDTNIPNYNKNIREIIEFPSAVQQTIQDFITLTSRPTSRQDAADKLVQFKEDFTRLQSLNFTLNQTDPLRILNGISPVETTAQLPTDAEEGDTVLVRHAPTDPQVYIYTSSSWQVMSNGFRDGNLGLNPDLITWIDSQTGGDKNKYIIVAEDLINELDVFISTYLQQTQVRLTLLLLGLDEKTELDPIVNFFKPAKCRFLSFEVLFKFNEALENSINLDDSGDAGSIDINLPEEMPETLRGGYPENYDEYDYGYDANQIFDNIDIYVYQDDGFGGTDLIPQEEWAV